MSGFDALCEFNENGSKLFAMTAPWGVEFNEEAGVVSKDLRQVSISQREDSIFLCVGWAKDQESENGPAFKHL